MIKARCFTNLDEYKGEAWPPIFYDIPRIGETIMSKHGKELKVVQICHTIMIEHDEKIPFVIIELNK